MEFAKAIEHNNEHPALHECHVLIMSSVDDGRVFGLSFVVIEYISLFSKHSAFEEVLVNDKAEQNVKTLRYKCNSYFGWNVFYRFECH